MDDLSSSDRLLTCIQCLLIFILSKLHLKRPSEATRLQHSKLPQPYRFLGPTLRFRILHLRKDQQGTLRAKLYESKDSHFLLGNDQSKLPRKRSCISQRRHSVLQRAFPGVDQSETAREEGPTVHIRPHRVGQ